MVRKEANTMDPPANIMRLTNSLSFLLSSFSPANVMAPPVEKGDTPAKCPPTMMAETSAVVETPVDNAISGMIGTNVGATTPNVLENKLMIPAIRPTIILATKGLKPFPNHCDKYLIAPAVLATDTNMPVPQTKIIVPKE